MSQIFVKLHRFGFSSQQELNNFIATLASRGYVPFYESTNTIRPVDGEYDVIAREFDYVTVDTMRTMHDLTICLPATSYSGYWLELPPGCRPAARDPVQDVPAATARPASQLRAAVLYMIEHGTSANAAAKHFGVASSNMRITMERMRRNGEI